MVKFIEPSEYNVTSDSRPETQAFAAWLRQMQGARGVTLRAIADRIGMSHSALSYLARGKVHPEMETCIKLAAFFHVPAREVLLLAGYDIAAERGANGISETQTPYPSDELDDPALRLQFYQVWRDVSEMTPEERDSILAFIRFVKEQKQKRASEGGQPGEG